MVADDNMAWAVPQFPVQTVNIAGRALAKFFQDDTENYSAEEWEHINAQLDVVNNWKQAHNYPLNTFQMNLRHIASKFDANAVVAQRVKRMVSIGTKLIRFPNMNLSQMQDIGGCRTVVASVDAVRDVVKHYQKASRIKHAPGSADDYITHPKPSGYRGVHLVYRYFSDKKKKAYNGLKIEMQIRSRFQHAWATAVETAGLFTGHALKSSIGDEDWLRFFSLMGSVVALREKTEPIPGTPIRKKDLIRELSLLADRLDVSGRLNSYATALNYMENDTVDAHWYLLQLNPAANELTISGFRKEEMQEAERRYAQAELEVRTNPGTDAVLVAVDSISELPKAYPNYYADTNVFLELLKQARSGKTKRVSRTKLKATESQLS